LVASPRLAALHATQGGGRDVCCSSTHDDPGCQMARRMGTAIQCSPCYHLNQMLPVCKLKEDVEV